jgi:hypothetical protein
LTELNAVWYRTCRVNVIVLWLLAAAIGPGVLALGLLRLYIEVRPRRWTSVPAVITTSHITRQYVGRGRQETIPVIEFEFLHEKSTVRLLADIYTTGSAESAAAAIARYPLGAAVTVYVNPNKPCQASLETHITPASWLLLLIGALVSIGEISLFY